MKKTLLGKSPMAEKRRATGGGSSKNMRGLTKAEILRHLLMMSSAPLHGKNDPYDRETIARGFEVTEFIKLRWQIDFEQSDDYNPARAIAPLSPYTQCLQRTVDEIATWDAQQFRQAMDAALWFYGGRFPRYAAPYLTELDAARRPRAVDAV